MATLISPSCCALPPPPPPPPVAVDRLADEHSALPPKLPAASTFACTPQMSAATATGTWTVLLDRSTLTSPLCWADAGPADTPSAIAHVESTAASGRFEMDMLPPSDGFLALPSDRASVIPPAGHIGVQANPCPAPLQANERGARATST